MKTFWLKIKKWYQGEFISSNVAIGGGHYERSALANIINNIVDYCKKHPQIAIPLGILIVGTIGLIIGILNLLLNILH